MSEWGRSGKRELGGSGPVPAQGRRCGQRRPGLRKERLPGTGSTGASPRQAFVQGSNARQLNLRKRVLVASRVCRQIGPGGLSSAIFSPEFFRFPRVFVPGGPLVRWLGAFVANCSTHKLHQSGSAAEIAPMWHGEFRGPTSGAHVSWCAGFSLSDVGHAHDTNNARHREGAAIENVTWRVHP